MASASPAHSETTNCPQCQSLCLSPTILPCGHLHCRKCLRQILEDRGHKPACGLCGHGIPRQQEQTISQLAEQLGKDLVLEDLVMKQLASQGNVFCVACPNKFATKMCVDCGEMYCYGCSNSHMKMRVSKDHVQEDLPQVISNTHSATGSFSNDNTSMQDTVLPSNTNYSHGPDPGNNKNKESLRQEARLLQEEVSQLREAMTVVDTTITRLHELKQKLEKRQELLTTYLARLARPDDSLLTNTRPMLVRLKRVREDCRPPRDAALTRISKQVSSLLDTPNGAGAGPVDPLTVIPTQTSAAKPDCSSDEDESGPWILSMVITRDGRLVMTDWNNKMVKVATLSEHQVSDIQGLKLSTEPIRLALLNDGNVALTSSEKRLYIVDVSGYPTLVANVKTDHQYNGISAMKENDNLLVTCDAHSVGRPRVDIITRQGRVLMSLTSHPEFCSPAHVCVLDREILLSDCEADAVFRVNLDTGAYISKITHPDLKYPCQVSPDDDGNLYIASRDGRCVMMLTTGGQWKRLLDGREHGVDGRDCPACVCVTDWGIVVTWRRADVMGDCVVVGYRLM